MRIVQSLETFLKAHFLQAKQRNSKAVVRPVLIGPPGDILQLLFDNLTDHGKSDWLLSSEEHVAVLLILGSKAQRALSFPENQISRECHWDYAVNVRNSYPLVLMLVDPSAWDTCPESLVNTTEVLGFLQPSQPGKWFSNPLWKNLIQQMSANLGVEAGKIKDALSRLMKESDYHDIPTKHRFLWETANDLLNAIPGTLPPDDGLAFKVGFPSLGQVPRTIGEADRVLKRLADFIKRLGLSEGIDKLKNTQTAISQHLLTCLDDFERHISRRSLSGVNFSYSPIWHYRSPEPVPDWWIKLTVDVWEALLEDTGDKPHAQLNLSCENALNKKELLPKEPLIVISDVQLKATSSDGLPLNNIVFHRRMPSHTPVILSPVPGDETSCIDTDWIPHDRAIKYTVDGHGFRTGAVEVMVLNSFGCRGTCHIRDAESNPPPIKIKKQNIWRQEIILPRGGAIDIDIYHVNSIEGVKLSGGTLQESFEKTIPLGQSKTTFVIVIEGETNFKVTLLSGSGATDSEWEVNLTIQEATEIARTRFDALVSAHKGTGKLPIPNIPDSPLLRIEDHYLTSPESWRPILACWTDTTATISKIDWRSPRLGSIEPKLGLPPAIDIPGDVLKAREEVRAYLVDKKRYIEEVELDDPVVGGLVENYLTSYLAWLNNAPDEATWMDCIAIYSAKRNPQAGDYSASDEPVAIVLSPLHPVKIGWQALAQQYLSIGLQKRCPAAGLLSPSKCPDIGGWAIRVAGTNHSFRAFFAAPCDNPYWGFLWNKKYLNDEIEKLSILRHLQEVGLETQSITGGFSRSQAVQSIDDVSKLLPGRATLRIGIIGAKDSSAALSDGVIEWCKKQFGEDFPEYPGSVNVEIYDMRGAIQPTPGVLAVLSEQTQEKARWFRIENVSPDSRLDLVILDQLGSSSLSADKGCRRSVLGAGGLYRSRIRQDFEGADLVMETRVGKPSNYYGGLDSLLHETVVFFEELATRDSDTTHFRFRPNQQAIGNRLQQSTYLAITSSQLDPGGIIRGVTGQEGYLWDYELPGILGGNEESAGYYLLAKPLESMKDAIRNSASIVTNTSLTQDDIQVLIAEISRRGIPVLKRLASGGTQSRGELGLLLGTRLLQDVFNPAKPSNGLPVWYGNCIHLILPVDPFDEPFEKIRVPLCGSKTSPKRPDLLVVAITIPPDNQQISIKITPVEVKFRGNTMSLSQMQEALEQASNLGIILDAAWAQSPLNELWDVCCRALLAECLDFAFRIYANPDIHKHLESEWAEIHETVLEKVLSKGATVTINASGRLLVFDQSNKSSMLDVDSDGRLDTAVICPSDAMELLAGSQGLIKSQQIVDVLDFSFPSCLCHDETIEHGKDLSVVVSDVSEKRKEPEGNESEEEASPPVPSLEQPVVSVTPDVVPESTSLVPAEVRSQVNNAFVGFIGNEAAVKRLKNDLLSALIEKPPHLSKNFLFYGEPSTGKTELARRIATALKLPFVKLDGRGLVSRERLFELVNGELSQQGLSPSQVGQQSGLPLLEYPPLIIFVDEVHLMPKSIQESLLTVLEAVDRTVTMKTFVARMNKTTFLFATTRPSEVDKAFRSRCADVSLREYTVEEVAEMLKRRFSKEWPEHVYLQLAKLGRRVPRVAISLATDLETAIKVSDHPNRSIEEHLDEVRKTHEMDDLGLKPLDFQYLETLKDEGKPVGEQAMVNLLATADKDRVIDEVEPFLRKLGFIRFGSRGREITEKGKNYLLEIEKGKGIV